MKNQIRRITATRAAREFSRLLDRIESGAEFVIERRAQPVAQIGPTAHIPRKISECAALPLRRTSARPDPDFADDLLSVVRDEKTEEPPSWD